MDNEQEENPTEPANVDDNQSVNFDVDQREVHENQENENNELALDPEHSPISGAQTIVNELALDPEHRPISGAQTTVNELPMDPEHSPISGAQTTVDDDGYEEDEDNTRRNVLLSRKDVSSMSDQSSTREFKKKIERHERYEYDTDDDERMGVDFETGVNPSPIAEFAGHETTDTEAEIMSSSDEDDEKPRRRRRMTLGSSSDSDDEEEPPSKSSGSKIDIVLQEYKPQEAEEGQGWVLVEPVSSGDGKIKTTSNIIHRGEGEGEACPLVVRGNQPEITLTPADTSIIGIGDDEVFARIRWDGENLSMTTRAAQTDWDWVEDMVCSNDPAVFTVRIKTSPPKSDQPPVKKREKREKKDKPKTVKKKQTKDKTEKHRRISGISGVSGVSGISGGSGGSGGMLLGDAMVAFDFEDGRRSSTWYGSTPQSQCHSESYLPESAPSSRRPTKETVSFTGELPQLKCEFCAQPLVPFPTMEQQQTDPPENLFCCEAYREFFESTWKEESRIEVKASSESLIIDVKPHPHFGSVAARKIAKQQAQQKQRDLVELKQTKSQSFALTSHSLHNFGRQMKTINYQLSNHKCIEDGWTLRFWDKPYLTDDEDEYDMFIPRPLKPGVKPKTIHQTYPNGSSFLIMFGDGSGTVYYPNGRPAIIIIPVDRCQYFYQVLADTKAGLVLGVFDPSGIATCCDITGTPRLITDAVGGTNFDQKCDRKHVWRWHELEPHVHAPPLQPISITLSDDVRLRILTQDNVQLTFRCYERSVRFNVGTKLKVTLPANIPPREIDPVKVYLGEMSCKIDTILNKVNNISKYKKSPKAALILPPLYISGKMERVSRMKRELTKTPNKDKFITSLVVS